MQTVSITRWLLLEEVYKRYADEAGAKVVAQRAIVFAEISKLRQLQGYADEYAIDQNVSKSSTLLENSRRFFAKLAQAIDHQKKNIEVQNQGLATLEKAWLECIEKHKSFRTLVERGEKTAQDDMNKKEQNTLDEWNSGRFSHLNVKD